jgi:hypothetical protein
MLREVMLREVMTVPVADSGMVVSVFGGSMRSMLRMGATGAIRRRHHGTVGYSTRIPTGSGVRELRRFGFATKADADKVAAKVWDLIGLAGSDTGTQGRIGDMIFRATVHGGELPDVENVRRRLGLRQELYRSETFGEAWAIWLAGRRKARPSYTTTLAQHGRNWLLPVLADIPLERMTGEHCAMVFERVDMFNEEIEAAREGKRKPILDQRFPPQG